MIIDISVVIPTTPKDSSLQTVLSSLEAQQDVEFEVIVVLNPPTATWPRFEYKNNNFHQLTSEVGVNNARNVGLARAKSDLVLFLDSDCVPQTYYFLYQYVQLMRCHSDLVGGGGPYLLPTNSNPTSTAYHHLQQRWLQEGFLDENFNCLNLLGGNLILRKSLIKDQLFDGTMIFGGTERELLRRLQSLGHKFQFWPQQKVLHLNQINLIALAKKAMAQGRGTKYITTKLGPRAVDQKNTYLIKTSFDPKLTHYIEYYQFFFDLGCGYSLFCQFRKFWLKFWGKPLSFLKNLMFFNQS